MLLLETIKILISLILKSVVVPLMSIPCLSHQTHLPCFSIIACGKCIEVNSTGDWIA